MKRKGFFSELRDKQLKERLKSSNRSHGSGLTLGGGGAAAESNVWKSPSSAYSSFSEQRSIPKAAGSSRSNRANSDDERDIWSFEGPCSSVEINLDEPGKFPVQPLIDDSNLVPDGPTKLANLSNRFRKLDGFISTGNNIKKSDQRKIEMWKTKSIEVQKHKKLKSSFNTISTGANVGMAAEKLVADEDEIIQLESSITVEQSPVKAIYKKKARRKRLVVPSPKVHSQVIEGNSQISENLSSQISEIPSTQSSVSEPKTPLSVWIQQDQSIAATNEEIDPIDSPNQLSRHTQSRRRLHTTKSSSLLESFLSIKTRYESSARLFAHDLRQGKYDENDTLNLFIRKVIERQDKHVQTLAYDIKNAKDRWVILRPSDLREIEEGTFVQIYPPWQETPIPGTHESILIGTDFYKIVKSLDLHQTQQDIDVMCKLPLPTQSDIRVTEPLFMNIVPLHIKNRNTIRSLADKIRLNPAIDIVILQAWALLSPPLFLVKDSENFMSFLEVSNDSNLDVIASLIPGKKFRLMNIGIAEKICISKKLAPFSVMYLYGGTQSIYYALKWQCDSKHMELDLDISIAQSESDFLIIDEIYTTENRVDRRISLKCKVKEKDVDYILVTDKESDRSLKIEFVLDATVKHLSIDVNSTILLKFIRVIHGKTIWDCFTTYEEITDDEDSSFDYN